METNKYGHGAGCKCVGNRWEDRYECPWHGYEAEFNGVPFSIWQCQVCYANTTSDLSLLSHMQWHEKMGHLE